MSYKESLYTIIESASFSVLPTQELIDTDERIARAVWNGYTGDYHYHSDYGYDYFDRYKSIKWAEILHNYKENIEFWKSIDLSNELKNIKFRELFPHITNVILSDNNELIRLFNETRDMNQ